MATFILMRGISGSGKSTEARKIQESMTEPVVVVSRDDIRLSLYNVAFGPPIDEGFVTSIERQMITSALGRDISVISDNTNLVPRNVHQLIGHANIYKATLVLREIEVPLALAKNRNDARGRLGGRYVPEEVIDHQHSSFYLHQEKIAKIFE